MNTYHPEDRYIPRSIVRNNSSVLWGVYDTKTDTWLRQAFHEEFQAKIKCDELNRLKNPH